MALFCRTILVTNYNENRKKIVRNFGEYTPEDLTKKWFLYYKCPESGKRVRLYGNINQANTYADRKKAIKELRLSEERADLGKPTNLEVQIRDLLAADLGRLRKKTIQSYRSCINDVFAHLKRDEPTNLRFKSYFADLRSRKSAQTHNKTLTAVRIYLKKLGRQHLLADITTCLTDSEPDRYFQSYQRRKLSDWLTQNDPELLDFCQFIYYTFARPGELRKMLLSDILADDWLLLFRGKISKNKKTQYVKIPLPFRKTIERLLSENLGSHIFEGRKGKPYGSGTMYQRHCRALAAAGMTGQGYTLYSWKHTGAVAAAKKNIPLKQLQLQLRHHSLDQVDAYLRQMGVVDLSDLSIEFPPIDE